MPSITKTKLELHASLIALGACAAVVSQPAGAQEEGLTVEVGECVDLPTPEQRLACFEAQVEAARRERGALDPAPAARGAEPPPARRAEPQPARSVEPQPARSSEPAPRSEPSPAARPAEPAPRVVEARVRTEPQRSVPPEQDARDGQERRLSRRQEERAERLANPEIFATVAQLRETVPNSFLITLDNGQVWRQTVPLAYGLREGAEVRLYPSRWGDSYRLTDDDLRGYIQVERVR